MPLLPLMIIFLRSRVSKDTLNKVSVATETKSPQLPEESAG
jgi:hypothetical protein